jgi:rubrerythrin
VTNRVQYKLFRATFKSWEKLCAEAADFAGSLSREQVISVSHSSDGGEGLVVVWYWGPADTCRGCGYDLTGNTSGVCPECGRAVGTAVEGRG